MIFSLFVEGGAASGGWTVYPPIERVTAGHAGFWNGHDSVVDFHGFVCCELAVGRTELCSDHYQSANEGHVHDTASVDDMGLHGYCDCWVF